MNKKNKIIILVSFIVFIIFNILYFLNSNLLHLASINSESPPLLIKEKVVKDETINSATLEINEEKYKNQINENSTVADFMDKLKTEGKITFEEKKYSGMGKFIESINGIKNNGEKNWIYYVNNKKANIGISNYKINNGDIISWKYEFS